MLCDLYDGQYPVVYAMAEYFFHIKGLSPCLTQPVLPTTSLATAGALLSNVSNTHVITELKHK